VAKPATGAVLHHQSVTSARIRIAPGAKGRPSFQLAVTGKEAARARVALLAELAKRLRPVASKEEIRELLTVAGKARTPADLAEALDAANAVASGNTSKAASALAPTVEAFAKAWTSGELRKAHPDHVREKDSSEDVQILRDYVNPAIGSTRLPDVTLEHAERVMRRVPATLAPRTRRHVAQCMRKLLSLAVYPGRYLAANPIPREWMPRIPKSANKAKACLYPSEDALLMRCKQVLLERRLAYGILCREGMRASELGTLKWRDVDLERGRVRLDENKTDDPRAWALSPDVARVLTWWKERTQGEAGGLVLGGLDLTQGPRWLRGKTWDPKTRHKDELGDLLTAGVTRTELFERTKARMPIRLHDLRATFVTVSLANGKTEQWVTDRTGHKSSQMIAAYKRQARTWGELALGTLGPLDELLPELGEPAAAEEEASTGPESGEVPVRAAVPLAIDWPSNSSDCWTRTSDPAVNRLRDTQESRGVDAMCPIHAPRPSGGTPRSGQNRTSRALHPHHHSASQTQGVRRCRAGETGLPP
jgi:integrase